MLPTKIFSNNLIRYSFRRVSCCVSSYSSSYRAYSTAVDPMALPTPDDESKEYPEKIKNLVNEISQLSILEVADLNSLLKKTLNISEAPMMAMGAMPVAAQKEEEESGDTKVQTCFTLRITKYDESKKVALIKAIKSVMEGMNLVQAKKFVESLPAVVRKDSPKEEVEKLQEELSAVGAECVIE
ncbi:39S ribosomal protein L12, mitochondrial [Armadillidium nasatum]|uniref:39S ribosomal protein L12, mitochondrial n=1 Tax=Armadillidium nasatum TaxID=96803 RepID=A0A5N5TBX8_9CRUS|nr:39S ribosomal protein L12, mitochondrial [Armadillidium nasatum]